MKGSYVSTRWRICHDGQGAILENGTVTGCTFGVDVDSKGSGHFIEKVAARNNAQGFGIGGSHNELRQNLAVGNAGDGQKGIVESAGNFCSHGAKN